MAVSSLVTLDDLFSSCLQPIKTQSVLSQLPPPCAFFVLNAEENGYDNPPPDSPPPEENHDTYNDHPMDDEPTIAAAAVATTAAMDHHVNLESAQPMEMDATATVAATAAGNVEDGVQTPTLPFLRDPSNRMFAESHSVLIATPPGTPLGQGQDGWSQGYDWQAGG